MEDEWRGVRDREELNILATINFTLAGVCALLLGVVLIDQGIAHIEANLGLFIILGFLLSLLPGALCLANALQLRRRRARALSYVVAVLQCLAVPLGTLLGIWTIWVLSRPSVVDLYKGKSLTTAG